MVAYPPYLASSPRRTEAALINLIISPRKSTCDLELIHSYFICRLTLTRLAPSAPVLKAPRWSCVPQEEASASWAPPPSIVTPAMKTRRHRVDMQSSRRKTYRNRQHRQS